MSKTHTNRLSREESPYLKQHAHNPVDWYAWSDEALQQALKEDKPILVSIGYSTCHWCHVMERESFEDEATAQLMNEYFISIKVDREERPDIDHLYMEAVQLLGVSGGWPLNVFLTPDAKPFYGGTYFPPTPKYNRPSWKQVLQKMHQAFQEQRQEVEQQADKLMEMIQESPDRMRDKFPARDWQLSGHSFREKWQHMYYAIREDFDRVEGGFGRSTKFPQVSTLSWLQAYGYLSKTEEAKEHVRFTLSKMVAGGIFDHLAGGFSRYTVDRAWKIPHFEKMLYDNALLLGVLSDEHIREPHPFFERAIRKSIDYLVSEMRHEDGGFYSALDADSEGEEGKFYVWSWEELTAVLGPEELGVLRKHVSVAEEGNWEGKNILYLREDANLDLDEQLDRWEAGLEALEPVFRVMKEKRDERTRPGTDTKRITGWNAMLICGLFKSYLAVGDEDWLAESENLLRLLHREHRDEGGNLLRNQRGAKREIGAYLEDEAWFIRAVLQMYPLLSKEVWRPVIEREIEFVLANFYEKEQQLFYENSLAGMTGPARVSHTYDAGVPSGNAVMIMNLLEAAILFDRADWRGVAEEMLMAMSGVVAQFPSSFSYWGKGLMALDYGIDEFAVLGPEWKNRAIEIMRSGRPFKVVEPGTEPDRSIPLLKGKKVAEATLMYLCAHYECKAPVKNLSELSEI